MTQTADLLAIAQQALIGQTDAEARVYTALDWPTVPLQYPMINLRTPHESKESLGRSGPPKFNVVATLKVEARMEVPAKAGGASAALLEQHLARLGQQIQAALIGNPAFYRAGLQQFPFVRSEMEMSADGAKETGANVVEIGLEFFQTGDDFFPLPITPMTSMQITVDAQNVADPTGTYPDAPFPDSVIPAPRTHGPDGRAEGGMTLQFPSED